MFTIYINYSKSSFDLTVFLKSLENSNYEVLMKEVEEQVDKKQWLNKEGLPFGAKAIASRVKQLIVSLDVMIARYFIENTIVVDDSPVKHVLNPLENIILPESWTFASASQSDTYLMDTLLPWVLQLYVNQEQGIPTFQNHNRIGRPMMCEDPFDLDFSEILKAIEDDHKFFHCSLYNTCLYLTHMYAENKCK